MFRPFRKLLVKMRDYLRTLNKNELFQLEKLLCTNEEINLAQSLSNNSNSTTADENVAQCCDGDAKKVTVIVPSCEKNENDQNFYSIKNGSNGNNNSEWVSEENSGDREEVNDEADNDEEEEEEEDDNSENFDDDNLVTADCATGFLVPNTTLGN